MALQAAALYQGYAPNTRTRICMHFELDFTLYWATSMDAMLTAGQHGSCWAIIDMDMDVCSPL